MKKTKTVRSGNQKGGVRMKKVLVIIGVMVVLFGGCGYLDFGPAYGAETETTETTSGISITTKQAVFFIPDTQSVKQMTAFEVIKTDADQVASWPKWVKAVYAGWTLDAGFAYDDTKVLESGALALGRRMGTLGDYLPLKFPLMNKIEITLYPAMAYCEKLLTNPQRPKYGFGAGYIKAEIKF